MHFVAGGDTHLDINSQLIYFLLSHSTAFLAKPEPITNKLRLNKSAEISN